MQLSSQSENATRKKISVVSKWENVGRCSKPGKSIKHPCCTLLTWRRCKGLCCGASAILGKAVILSALQSNRVQIKPHPTFGKLVLPRSSLPPCFNYHLVSWRSFPHSPASAICCVSVPREHPSSGCRGAASRLPLPLRARNPCFCTERQRSHAASRDESACV